MKGLCDSCQNRKNSKITVQEAIDNGYEYSCDPAPKAECKWHNLYGHANEFQKINCTDFKPLEDTAG